MDADELLRRYAAAERDFSNLDLSVMELREANLVGANLKGANLSKTDLREARLGQVNLTQAHLKGANLSETILWGTDFSEANLHQAELREADLSGAKLIKAHLEETIFAKADLRGANLSKDLGFLMGIAKNRKVLIPGGEFTQVKNLAIPEQGLVIHLKKFGQVKVFRRTFKNEATRYYIMYLPNPDATVAITREEFKEFHSIH